MCCPPFAPHPKHDITHGRFKFRIPSPSPYKRSIWDYSKAKLDEIRRSVSDMNWQALFYQQYANGMALVIQTTSFYNAARASILIGANVVEGPKNVLKSL